MGLVMVAITHHGPIPTDIVAKLVSGMTQETHGSQRSVVPEAGRSVVVHVDDVLIPVFQLALVLTAANRTGLLPPHHSTGEEKSRYFDGSQTRPLVRSVWAMFWNVRTVVRLKTTAETTPTATTREDEAPKKAVVRTLDASGLRGAVAVVTGETFSGSADGMDSGLV